MSEVLCCQFQDVYDGHGDPGAFAAGFDPAYDFGRGAPPARGFCDPDYSGENLGFRAADGWSGLQLWLCPNCVRQVPGDVLDYLLVHCKSCTITAEWLFCRQSVQGRTRTVSTTTVTLLAPRRSTTAPRTKTTPTPERTTTPAGIPSNRGAHHNSLTVALMTLSCC